MPADQEPLEAAISALEAQRALLGDAVVDASVAARRARLAALVPAPASDAFPAQTLRQVSILFLDVVGSTTLAQRLDPETISAVMDDALARGTAIVQAHGGKVLQYAGVDTLEGMNEPRLIEMTCYRVLAGTGGAGDPRAAEWLTRAHLAVQAQAATIADAALRRGFLHHIPHHREIIAAWAARPQEAVRDGAAR